MYFPYLRDISQTRDMTRVFGGYNHRITCGENEFFDMKNMTSEYFPVLSPRAMRGHIKVLKKPQGILDKDDIWWIDDRKLYKNGNEVFLTGITFSVLAPKTMAKMGAYIVIFPDGVYYNVDNGECGYLGNTTDSALNQSDATITLSDERGNVIEYHTPDYFEQNEPKDGDLLMTASDSKPALKVYSSATKIWSTVTSTYITISFLGAGKGFKADDSIVVYSNSNKGLENIFVNAEADGIWSINTYIVDRKEDSITIPGIFSGELDEQILVRVERKIPSMSYITEYGNRLWGCSRDGREIYCCKLGDVKNWYSYRGISTDAWAGTIGSDGAFTGAITYNDSPTFFKEDGIYRVMVSAGGAHAVRETKCRGVQNGCAKSLAVIDEILYYKSPLGVCAYNGGVPVIISEDLGNERYSRAVAGASSALYYISMKNSKGEPSLFVYDTLNKLWVKEDSTEALFFCSHDNELYFVDASDNTLKSAGGSLEFSLDESRMEDSFSWSAESGDIGYSSPDYKYLVRVNLRLTLEAGSCVDFWVQYDSSGEWEHKFRISGAGTRSESVPFIPKRCDHFRYKISGVGNCKIHSLTKTVEEGSDD